MEEFSTTNVTVTMEENRMKKHLTIVGILQIVFGAFLLLAALAVGFLFTLAGTVVNDPFVSGILGIIGIPLVIIMLVFGAAMIAGGIGIIYCKPWARIVTMVMASIGLLNIPVGTLKGVYILWVLLQTETIALFAKGCSTSPATTG